jgi:hypothetical protein
MPEMYFEYDQIRDEIATLQNRNRCFDLSLARVILRIIRIHNAWMTHALEGDRGCERAVAEQLDFLEQFTADKNQNQNQKQT